MYKINQECWKPCKLCNRDIKSINKKYGKSGKYATQNFKDHLTNEHDLSLNEYFMKYDAQPTCYCGMCKQKCSISATYGKDFFWRKYMCGCNEGIIKWSKEAKTSRLGKNNPMFGKKPWNDGLTKESSEILKTISEKRTGCKPSLTTRRKQSSSALKRIIHGHTGKTHSEYSKSLMREATLLRIKNGEFKHTKTKPHIIFGDILNKLNIKYIEEKIVEFWSFDYYLIDHDVYVEVDGDYFHSNAKLYPNGPQTKTQKINFYRDIKKNKFCSDNNIKLFRFWESDILNNWYDILCNLVKLLG